LLEAIFTRVKSPSADQLRLIALIDAHGSLAGAADELGLTPAAITQRLARAEETWGLPLVDRGPRGASLTPAGQTLAQFGHRIHTESIRAQEAFDVLRGVLQHRLRIGAFQAAALHLVPPALTALRHRDSTADISLVDIQSREGVGLVADGDLDLAVVATWDDVPEPPASVRLHQLMRDPMVLVIPDDHPLASRRSQRVGLRDLRDESWVVIRAGHEARRQLDRAAHAAGFAPKVRFETESYDVAQALVATGYGVALVSRLALNDAPGTTSRQLAGPRLHRTLHAVTPTDREATPLVTGFLGLLADVAQDLTRQWSSRPVVG
jgi:DNA-binding transcriptional LysR family regulator